MKKIFVFISALLGLSCVKGMNKTNNFELVTKNVSVREDAYGTQLAKECYERENRKIGQVELSTKDEENLRYILEDLVCHYKREIYFIDYERKDGNKVAIHFSRIGAYPIHESLRNATFKWLKENNFVVKRSKHRSDEFYTITLPKV